MSKNQGKEINKKCKKKTRTVAKIDTTNNQKYPKSLKKSQKWRKVQQQNCRKFFGTFTKNKSKIYPKNEKIDNQNLAKNKINHKKIMKIQRKMREFF